MTGTCVDFLLQWFAVVNPDQTFEMRIDNGVINKGSLLEDFLWVAGPASTTAFLCTDRNNNNNDIYNNGDDSNNDEW